MQKYKLIVVASADATEVLDQVGISYKCYSGAHPPEINKDEELLEFCNKIIESEGQNTIAVVAYTHMKIKNEKIGVPINKAEAKKMLLKLSGKTHSYVSRMCIGGAGEPVELVTAETKVSLKNLEEWEIDGYLSFEDFSYPGAYLPTGKGAFFTRSILGDFNIIKGIPLALLIEKFEQKYGITPENGKNIWWKGNVE